MKMNDFAPITDDELYIFNGKGDLASGVMFKGQVQRSRSFYEV